MMSRPDVVVVGGGVVGLSTAYLLALEGAAVTVLDRGPLGREASWAGAGIIAPGSPLPPGSGIAALRARSAALHPEWSARLRDESGIDNGYWRCGALDVAFEPGSLAEQAVRLGAESIPHERLGPADLRAIEPGLSPEIAEALLVPGMAQIRNPRHLKALIIALERRGVDLRPGEPATAFRRIGDRIAAVLTAREVVACKAVVLTAGAWSGALADLLPLPSPLPTPPVRGQIVLLRGEPAVPSRIVEHGLRYLVPRGDGRILVGSTEEDAGFDARTTAAGTAALLAEAIRLVPALADFEVERTWAGLRPGSSDSRPYIGVLPGLTNAWIAAGHRRVGLQLSPATAEAVAALVLGQSPRIDLTDLDPARKPGFIEEDTFRS